MDDNMTTTDLWLIGLRLDADIACPTFYTLLIGEEQQPLIRDQQLVMCAEIGQFIDLSEGTDLGLSRQWLEQVEVELVCDIAEALYIVEQGDHDEDATVVNCLNTLFDLIKATNGTIPAAYRQHIEDLADHTTFSKSVGDFFQSSTELRGVIIEGLVWCVGWVMTHAHIVNTRISLAEEHDSVGK